MTVVQPRDATQHEVQQHNDGMSGGPPRFFAFVQLPSGTVVVGSCTRGMSRSTDSGRTWTPVEDLAHVSQNGFALGSRLVAARRDVGRTRPVHRRCHVVGLPRP